ncbi:mediator of DNA damage checkpoint protein 1 isoform X3 [Balaenoptera ricei]|uniref:mediator of DNA damage checkpoint protein 1 isoform X3 n=1 Tax=Balaenoptera ricei TaxID=2746895 RepID=UPI0028BE6B13|nr:mediator of DNA damage checkpoint protein 1 isoform X3 [Balaenoptera ricei]
MEDTQVINWEVEEEEEVEERPSESLGCSSEPLGRLRIFSSSYGPEKDFPLYLGKNVVGRMPDCSVALPYSSISKQHAVIEILAWDKAPVLRDCGSLNGTQILRPPKVLGPGVSHRLRDRELILFADLPCQYHRLDVPLSFVSRGPLTVEETPRVQGGTQPHRLLLAEDSEEEVDSLSEKCVVKGPRTSFLATVVPESDEEGPSSALDGPGPPFAFNLNSDTDEEESQQPGAGEPSSAARRVTAAETEQPKPVTTEIQLEKDQCSVKEKNNDTKVERNARSGVVPVGVILERSQPAGEDSDTDVDDESGPLRRLTGVHLERAQPCGFIDSDTDVEEEGIPATPAVVPVRKRHIFHEVGTESPRAPGVAHRQESPAGSDTDIEEREAPLTVPLDRSRASVVIDSNTDDKEEVSAALTLAHLRESRAVAWNRDADAEEDRAQPVALLEQSQASAGRDSDTDVKEKGLPVEKTGTVPRGHTGKAYSEKSQPPLRDSDTEVMEEKSSLGFHLQRSRASATVHVNTQVVEEVPPGPAVTLLEKHQVPVAWTRQTDVEAEGGPAKLPVVYLEEAQPPLAGDCGPDAEENTSLAASAVADVRKSQLHAEEDTGTEWAAAVLEQGRAFMAGAQGGSPAAQVEQDLLPVSRNNIAHLVVDTGTPGEPTQPQREGAQTPTEREREPHVDRTMNSGDNHDDSEDLDLQATQCFVERENQSLEVPSMEDEPTQAFLFTLPQEPGPSRCSFQATGSLDEPWEVLATQPFCPRESEASETQLIATHIEAHGPCPSPPTAAPQEQHPESPVHAESLGIQGRGMQTVEEDMGYLNCKMPPAEKTSRGDQESPAACRPPAVQEASAPLQNPLISQSPKSPAPQSLLSPSPPPSEPPIPRTRQNESQEALETPFSSELDALHPKPKVKPQGSSPVSSVPLEPHPTPSTDQPVTPKPTSRATRGRTLRSSVKTPERNVSTAPELQPSAHTDQPVTPKPTSQATRGRTQRASVKTPEPVISTAPEPQPCTSTDQPVTPKPTSRATRGRALRSSVKTPERSVSTAPELQNSAHTDQPVTPKPTSRATRGRALRSSVKTPERNVPTAPELQNSAHTDQPVTPKPTSRATRGRALRSSVKTPERSVSTAPELQNSAHTDQPVTPKPTSRATRGRALRSSVKTPEQNVPTAPELQPSAHTDQPVTPKPTSRGRTQRASVKTPEPVISTAPEPQPSTSTDQPVTPKPTSRATRGRALRSSVKTPERSVSTAPELQPSAHTDQPVTPKPTSQAPRGRTLRSSAKTPEPVVPITPEPQPSTSKDQSLTPEPTSQATRGRTHRSSVKTSQPTEPTAPYLEPSSPTDQPVTPKVIAQCGQSRTLRSSTVSAVPVPTTPEFHSPVPTEQPIPPEPIPEANCSRRPRATRKPGSLTAHVHEPYSAPSEPNSRSSRNQRRGAVRAAESLSTIPEPAFAQLPEAPTHAPQIPKGEAADRSGFTPEPQPEASQNHKRPLATVDSPPLQKRLQREVPQKTAFLKEEEENPAAKLRKIEDVVIPEPGKRKREQTEEEPREIPSRSLRRTKPIQESTAPKVLFTGVVDAHGERAVLALGGSMASSVAEASHLVTDRIRRTVKFLCALGRGIPILSLDWLHQSRKAGCFLPPAEYVVTDPEQEKNFGFSLREALSRARERRLLEGYEIHVTPGVQPPPPQMGEIISCCGGTVLPSMPRSYKPQRVVITCSQDFPRCAIPFRVGLPILSPEFLLTGVLKQEAKPEAFVLSTLEMSST